MLKVEGYPNFQVPAAELIRDEVGIITGAVGLIENGRQAEEMIRNGRADLALVGSVMLENPFWARSAADDLMTAVPVVPRQYTRYGSAWQRGLPPVPAAAPATTEGV